MEYEVRITVVQEITVPVEADTMNQAKETAMTNWKRKEYDDASTHSRRIREKTTFEPLYPDISMWR